MRHIEGVSLGRVIGTIVHLVLVLALGSVPMLLLNLPVGLLARAVADRHMADALAGSNVKVGPSAGFPRPHARVRPLSLALTLLFAKRSRPATCGSPR